MYTKIVGFLKAHFDKVLHFLMGMIIMLVAGIILPAWLSFFAVCIAAALKEALDQIAYGGFDWKDLIVTITGGALVWLCIAA
jgi:uncharacterized membrane protein YjdF